MKNLYVVESKSKQHRTIHKFAFNCLVSLSLADCCDNLLNFLLEFLSVKRLLLEILSRFKGTWFGKSYALAMLEYGLDLLLEFVFLNRYTTCWLQRVL